jgi:hypothetical protein
MEDLSEPDLRAGKELMMSEAEDATGYRQRGNEYSRKQLWVGVGLLALLIGCMGLVAVNLVLFAVRTDDLPRLWRGMIVAFAAVLGFVPLKLLWALGKRKFTTGRFLLGPSEARLRRAETLQKLGAGKPLMPQMGYWLVPLGASVFLLVSAVAIVAERSSWCDCDPSVRRLFYGLAGTLATIGLIYPVMCVLRKMRTGHFLPSSEKILARIGKCRKPAPKGQRVIVAAIFWADAVIFTDKLIRNRHPSAMSWLGAALWLVLAVIWTKQAIRPSTRQCAWSGEERSKEQPV